MSIKTLFALTCPGRCYQTRGIYFIPFSSYISLSSRDHIVSIMLSRWRARASHAWRSADHRLSSPTPWLPFWRVTTWCVTCSNSSPTNNVQTWLSYARRGIDSLIWFRSGGEHVLWFSDHTKRLTKPWMDGSDQWTASRMFSRTAGTSSSSALLADITTFIGGLAYHLSCHTFKRYRSPWQST